MKSAYHLEMERGARLKGECSHTKKFTCILEKDLEVEDFELRKDVHLESLQQHSPNKSQS